jgi:hypothetical protein
VSDSVNISARVPAYYLWVVERLKGRRFKNKSDAVAQIMAAWLASERDWLERNELGIRDFVGPRPVDKPRENGLPSRSRGR